MEKKKNEKNKLVYEKKNGWEKIPKKEATDVFKFSEKYIDFLSKCKTERETADFAVKEAKKRGFKEGKGDEFYIINRGKSVCFVIKGKEPIENGVRIIGSHIDSPRIDLKQNPLYEDTDLALFKTHYYGGIKKYQWVTIPLAIHGVVQKENGEKINVVFGEDDAEPVLTITDILPHLAHKIQMTKKMYEAIPGENLNILVGSKPIDDKDEKNKIKVNILSILNKKYGIKEEDFLSAELEIVPAGKARDLGIDASLVLGYGHDDKVCAYTSLQALFDTKKPAYTTIIYFSDKEEIGSDGNTGAKSKFLEDVILQTIENAGKEPTYKLLRTVVNNSQGLSSDVNAAVDPTYKSVSEMNNACKLNYGIALTKYTGSGGKYSANDCHAEFFGKIRSMFNKRGVIWQTGELGKVDEGGGGTIAKYMAEIGVETLDCGTPVLSMHAPHEVVSKLDVYETYKGYLAFIEEK
ncbi:MAG: aminopeptidase [Proteobacteria bacterium]|nr:aminopeptidase [Pseudomonadota bacterium]